MYSILSIPKSTKRYQTNKRNKRREVFNSNMFHDKLTWSCALSMLCLSPFHCLFIFFSPQLALPEGGNDGVDESGGCDHRWWGCVLLLNEYPEEKKLLWWPGNLQKNSKIGKENDGFHWNPSCSLHVVLKRSWISVMGRVRVWW